MTPVQRFLPPSYSDDLQAPRRSITGVQLPSAREISFRIHEDQNVETPSITHLLMQWGQFVDHDITSSSQSRGFNGSVPRCCKDGGKDFISKEFLHPECLPITVPPNDPFYGPRGVRCLDFVRSSPAPRDDCGLGWREQLNQVSAYIDGSPLYGSSARQSDKLRLFRNGMLQYGRVQQRRPILPPERKDELCRGGAVSTDCFRSGDGRVNEHPGLVAAHIVWLRQHNRMAQELAHLNPNWSDEKIYQETRKIVGAMIQHITYREFLPIVLGTEVMRLFELENLKKGYFKNYSAKVNASPASSFGSAAFRFGHSLVQPSMVRFDRFHRPMDNNVSLHNELTNPSNIWSMGAVDRLLLGMANQPIQKRDEFITEELTNHLFQTKHFDFGMDLAAINIQRGRDHGLPSYTAWREPCGLTSIQEFEDLFRVMPSRAARRLQSLYRSVDDIDLFTGGMAERPVVGGLVGPTFACIIAQQFSNLRKGDRFWYENGGFDSSFTPAQLQQIRRISLAQVLCRTLDSIDDIQPFVFLSPDNPDNDRIPCTNKLLNNFDLSPWVEIDSDSENDIAKSDQVPSSTKPPKRTTTTKKTRRTTTPLPTTTKDTENVTVANSTKSPQIKPTLTNSTRDKSKLTKMNITDSNTDFVDKEDKSTAMIIDKTLTKNLTVQKIDDKLDFKYKTRRYDDKEEKTRYNYKYNRPTHDYDYDEDNVQSVQSVVVNNLPHNNRPYSRPVIAVTENVDKYTYLINYVPRPTTQSWRHTTRKSYDRDVVKVTYQTYDDTYRRPSRPYAYYNRHDNQNNNDDFYRQNDRPTQTDLNDKVTFHSSARSNDDSTQRSRPTPNSQRRDDSTTDNWQKLVTFGYVGSYRGNDVTTDRHKLDSTTDRPKDRTTDSTTNKHVTKDFIVAKAEKETISKDFSTYVTKKVDTTKDDQKDSLKLSTFFLYETVTKPYNTLPRPTRRHDDDQVAENAHKYYYVKNILHKYPDTDIVTDNPAKNKRIDVTETHTDKEKATVEERSANKGVLEDLTAKSSDIPRTKAQKPTSAAKTPSVAFQVIPSENNPSHWAVYEENADLKEEYPYRMPAIMEDPHSLKEIPRPLDLAGWKKRRPGRT